MIPDIRTGLGIDVHAFEPGAGLWLGAVWIPGSKALVGHSDADVLLHALCDALLGAIGAGDIGLHFPPTDPQWKGKESSHFVTEVCRLVKKAGALISNVDVTVMGEEPKVSPWRQHIQAQISDLLDLEMSRVNIKATTTEKLGFLGRSEGLGAMVLATVIFPA